MFGGFVWWQRGVREDGTDSIAVPVADETHWPEMRALICVAMDRKKETSSTKGMQRSVATSALLSLRAREVVPGRISEIIEAYKAHDFDTFGRLTIQDSNQFHACCADTYPPIYYMNETAKAVVRLVHALNEESVAATGHLMACYTFDAGPNAVIFLLEKHVKRVLQHLLHYFPPTSEAGGFVTDPIVWERARKSTDPILPVKFMPTAPGALKKIYATKVGDAPRIWPSKSALDVPRARL
jgi:diphosphomevalonate decarboxylase